METKTNTGLQFEQQNNETATYPERICLTTMGSQILIQKMKKMLKIQIVYIVFKCC